jgi:hypothetical protein
VEKIHARRLLKLADFLRTVPQREFDMGEWHKGSESGSVCKTVACAAGWACSIPSFRRAGLRLNINDFWEEEDERGRKTKSFSGDVKFEPKTQTDRQMAREVGDESGCRHENLKNVFAAQAFFGLTCDQANYVFLPGSYMVDGKVTRKMVIDRIRELVKQERPDAFKAWNRKRRAAAA